MKKKNGEKKIFYGEVKKRQQAAILGESFKNFSRVALAQAGKILFILSIFSFVEIESNYYILL